MAYWHREVLHGLLLATDSAGADGDAGDLAGRIRVAHAALAGILAGTLVGTFGLLLWIVSAVLEARR